MHLVRRVLDLLYRYLPRGEDKGGAKKKQPKKKPRNYRP